jgi:hypothetical protein
MSQIDAAGADRFQVPVYEYGVDGNHVMRRRGDDWINATHILKVAEYDKPTRTRILEREVQKGVHEKVQGGYGKYQGTHMSIMRNEWIWLTVNSRYMDSAPRRKRPCTEEWRLREALPNFRLRAW